MHCVPVDKLACAIGRSLLQIVLNELQDLKDFMRSAGEITFADAHKQRVGDG